MQIAVQTLVLTLLVLSGSWVKVEFIEDLFSGYPGEPAVEELVLELVNQVRLSEGLNPLSADPRLTSAARQHCHEMHDLGYFEHESPVPGLTHPADRVYQSGLTDFAVGENIAVNGQPLEPAALAKALLDQWMNSPPHRANILKPDFTHLGAGVVTRSDTATSIIKEDGVITYVNEVTLKNYGTQVFSSRPVEFEGLSVRKTTARHIEGSFEFKTPSTIGCWIDGALAAWQKPQDGQVTIELLFPDNGDAHEVTFAYQPVRQGEFIAFLRDTLDPKNEEFDLVFKPGSASMEIIELTKRDFKKVDRSGMVLAGSGRFDSAYSGMIIIENTDSAERQYPVKILKAGFEFSVFFPENTGERELWFAVRDQNEDLAKNRIFLDTGAQTDNPFRRITSLQYGDNE